MTEDNGVTAADHAKILADILERLIEPARSSMNYAAQNTDVTPEDHKQSAAEWEITEEAERALIAYKASRRSSETPNSVDGVREE